MRTISTVGAIVIAAFLGAATPVLAGPYEDGLAAANSQDYATALRLWKPLADQGQAGACTMTLPPSTSRRVHRRRPLRPGTG